MKLGIGLTITLGALFILAAFLVPALAAAQVPDPAAGDAFLNALSTAIATGDWKWAAVLGVIALTYLVRTYGARLGGATGAFLASSRGGAATALVLSLLMALAPAIAGKVPWSLTLVRDALTLGLTAIGGWVGVRRLVGVVPPGTSEQPAPAPAAPAA